MIDGVFRGRIERIEPHGTFVRVGCSVKLVHAFEQSWYWPFDPSKHFREGQECDVWIGKLNPSGQMEVEVASFRRVFPEADPTRYGKEGAIVEGVVEAITPMSISAKFGEAQWADFTELSLGRVGLHAQMFTAGNSFSARIERIEEGPKVFLVPFRAEALA